MPAPLPTFDTSVLISALASSTSWRMSADRSCVTVEISAPTDCCDGSLVAPVAVAAAGAVAGRADQLCGSALVLAALRHRGELIGERTQVGDERAVLCAGLLGELVAGLTDEVAGLLLRLLRNVLGLACGLLGHLTRGLLA